MIRKKHAIFCYLRNKLIKGVGWIHASDVVRMVLKHKEQTVLVRKTVQRATCET